MSQERWKRRFWRSTKFMKPAGASTFGRGEPPVWKIPKEKIGEPKVTAMLLLEGVECFCTILSSDSVSLVA